MKIVQISLSDEEYETLRKVLKKRGMSVKEGVREAIRSWLVGNRDFSDDPFVNSIPALLTVFLFC